jgi:hypothetical protein
MVLLITKSVPFHCAISPAVVGAAINSMLSVKPLNANRLVEAPPGTFSEAVTLLNDTLFEVPTPCIEPLPSNVSNLLSTEEDKAVCDAKLAENEVAALALFTVTVNALAENEVATDELNVPVTVATLAALALNEVAIDSLNGV